MKVSVNKITNALAKITAITSGDKQIPGVLLDIETNKLTMCYTNGHKSVVEYLDVETDENDKPGKYVVDYNMLSRAISNCQPSGNIVVKEVIFTQKEGNIIQVSADQLYVMKDDEGNIVNEKIMANKKMDLHWDTLDSSAKTAVLSRMNYAGIFDTETENITEDVLDKAEFIDQLNRTSTEKGKLIYISKKKQCVFVANQAHLTVVPTTVKTLTIEEEDEIRGKLSEMENTTPEMITEAINNATARMHYSVSFTHEIAKAIAAILSKTSSDEVHLYTSDKNCSIFVESEESGEKVGIWFEMPTASKAHIGALERYVSMSYKTYQTMFIREFLADTVKGALESTKDTDITIKFSKDDDTGEIRLNIEAGSASKSISDSFYVVAEDVIDPTNTLLSKQFKISIKVLNDMLSQLKTDRVAIDFNIQDNDGNELSCVRISEIDTDKLVKEYENAREETKRLCEQQNIAFDPSTTPTPVELKLAIRDKTIKTSQYTALAR